MTDQLVYTKEQIEDFTRLMPGPFDILDPGKVTDLNLHDTLKPVLHQLRAVLLGMSMLRIGRLKCELLEDDQYALLSLGGMFGIRVIFLL